MAWRGNWSGWWPGSWEGDDEQPPGSMSGSAGMSFAAAGTLTATGTQPVQRPQVFFTTADDIQRIRRREYARWLEQDIDDETVCLLAAAVL